jgi:hypothetical protein
MLWHLCGGLPCRAPAYFSISFFANLFAENTPHFSTLFIAFRWKLCALKNTMQFLSLLTPETIYLLILPQFPITTQSRRISLLSSKSSSPSPSREGGRGCRGGGPEKG